MDSLYAIAALASAISAILAWVAKLKWSTEYSKAKDEIIRAKEAQLEGLKSENESLKELTPMKIREYFNSVKSQLEEYVESLKKQLELARQTVEAKDKDIHLLQSEGNKNKVEIDKITKEKNEIETKAADLANKLSALEGKDKPLEYVSFNLPKYDPVQIASLTSSYASLAQYLPNYGINIPSIEGLSKTLQGLSVTNSFMSEPIRTNLFAPNAPRFYYPDIDKKDERKE